MKEQQLSGLVSPVSGRRVLEKDHVFMGNQNNVEQPTSIEDIVAKIPLCEGNILIGNENNFAEESDKLKELISKYLQLRFELSSLEQDATFILQKAHPLLEKAQALNKLQNGILNHANGIVGIATLPNGQLWIGDVNNMPQPSQIIAVDNLPNLFYKKIWRGNILGRPVESDDLTALEIEVGEMQAQIEVMQSEILELQNWQIAAEAQIEEILLELGTLQAEIAGLQSELAAIQAELVVINGEIVALQAELAALGFTVAELGVTVAGLSAAVTGLGITVAGLSLTVAGHSIAISGLRSDLDTLTQNFNNATVTLVGDVVGAGLLSGPIPTVFTKTLNQIANAGDVNIAGYNLKNLNSTPEDDNDAINFKFLWQLLHDEVSVQWL